MITLNVPADRPVDPLNIGLLRLVDRVLGEHRIRYLVVGATARDLLLAHAFGFETQRATRDIDLAIAAESWAVVETIKSSLVATGQFQQDKNLIQRLQYTMPGSERGYPVDLLPFGGVAGDSHEIHWPPKQDIQLNVTGFEDALNTALLVQLADGLAIPLPSLANLAALKLIAWKDRHNADSKDAIDFAQIIRVYGNASNQERLYGAEQQHLEAADYDIEHAGARLLGADIRALVLPKTIADIRTLITDRELRDRLRLHMARTMRGSNDPVQVAEDLLVHLAAGLKV